MDSSSLIAALLPGRGCPDCPASISSSAQEEGWHPQISHWPKGSHLCAQRRRVTREPTGQVPENAIAHQAQGNPKPVAGEFLRGKGVEGATVTPAGDKEPDHRRQQGGGSSASPRKRHGKVPGSSRQTLATKSHRPCSRVVWPLTFCLPAEGNPELPLGELLAC